MSTIEVIPSGAALGAEIRGVDLSKPLSDDTRRQILAAWHEHLVLYFRGQNLSDPALLQFGECFGEVLADNRPVDYNRAADTEYPDRIDVISNVVVDGKPIGALGDGEALWHTDTQPVPNSALILHALETPSQGGRTRFGNMYTAYETLPDDLREQVEGRASIHDRIYGLQKNTLFHSSSATLDAFDKSRMPGPWWPIVRTHGETGRKALHLQREGGGYVVGLSSEDSDRLLERLWAHMTQPHLIWEHSWQVGDVLVWDNRCTIHARTPFQSTERRRLHRVTVKGEWPN
ncbi:TauD/TfdA dioxygenase family protein [Pseudomonas mangiferae]|uniref:TauD/TfdA family dioxygenase n=1 Tax=Pseudomonas mangiferae TaxID=2593654 RepID=A0A553GXG0_9PSED|nr:TauD/TfdA family dioxygenase [Pseudomonas mangiferae]TRX74181.1 TauD/TfdA family dioxygenase [Pseudomonas mangiferae]